MTEIVIHEETTIILYLSLFGYHTTQLHSSVMRKGGFVGIFVSFRFQTQ